MKKVSWLIENHLNGSCRPGKISTLFDTLDAGIENWENSDLQSYILEQLQFTVQHAFHSNNFYREKFVKTGFTPNQLTSIKDLKFLPFVTKEEIRGKPWVLLSVPKEEISQVHVSTGTTGGDHITVHYTWEDLYARDLAPALTQLVPVKETDMVINALPYEMSSAGLSFHRVFQDGAGAAVAPVGKGGIYSTPEKTLKIASDLEATVLITTPTYAVYLAEVGEQIGIYPGRDIPFRFIWLTGEGCSNAFRCRVESMWKAPAFFFYGSLECGPIGIECTEKNGYHIPYSHVFVEIIDPNGTRQMDPGEIGEIVVTTLLRKGSPIIRYRTGDLGYIEDASCPCGVRFHRLFLRGRVLDQLQIGDKSFSPFYIEEFLMRVPEVGNWYEFIPKNDRLKIRLEKTSPALSTHDFSSKIASIVEFSTGIPCDIEIMDALPRPTGKISRIKQEEGAA